MATNMYLDLGKDIKGGCAAAEHKDKLEILSWNHGFSQPTSPVRSSAGSGTVEQANHMNLSFTKYLDSATDDILKVCWDGKQLDKATLSCFRADSATDNKPIKYLEIEMQHVIIANFSVSGGPGDIPVENVSLDYGIVKYTYIPQKRKDGTGGSKQEIQHDLEQRKIS